MTGLYTVMIGLLAPLLQASFMLVFLAGFLLLSAVIWVFTAGLYLRKWYLEKRYG